MSDYSFITNQELEEDIEVLYNISCCKAEAKWATKRYIDMMQGGIKPQDAFAEVIKELRIGDEEER